jgi:hypothetical protein
MAGIWGFVLVCAALAVPQAAHAADGASIAPVGYGPWDVDLSGAGVVAVSRSRDGVRSVMVYCTLDEGIARARLAGLGEGLDPALKAIRAAGGIDAFGRIAAANQVEATSLDGSMGIDILIEGFHPDFVLDEDELSIGDDSRERQTGPDYPNLHLPVDHAADAFSVALRNCV